MDDHRRIRQQERQLTAIPSEFRELATWAWTELRTDLATLMIKHGMKTELAWINASRVARIVVTQVYGDITRERQAPTMGV